LLYVVRDLEGMNHESEAASSPDQTPGEQWIREAPASLKQTRWGLNLVVYGSALVFFAAVGVLYFLFGTEMQSLVMNVLPVMGFSGNLMILVGSIFCLSVPEQTRARRLLSGSVFFDPGILGLPLALFLKLAGNIGLILFALALRKLLLYVNRPEQMFKVYCLLGSTVMFLMGSWCMELVADLELVEFNLIAIYSVMLVGLFLYPCFAGSLKKALR